LAAGFLGGVARHVDIFLKLTRKPLPIHSKLLAEGERIKQPLKTLAEIQAINHYLSLRKFIRLMHPYEPTKQHTSRQNEIAKPLN